MFFTLSEKKKAFKARHPRAKLLSLGIGDVSLPLSQSALHALLKAAREQADITQEQLAERIDVSTQYVSDLERGVVGISVPTLKNLCVALGISSDRILFGQAQGSSMPALTDKCRVLSPSQSAMLADIIDSFIQAILSERQKQKP